MDAMSHSEYVEAGLLDMPFVATSSTDEFIEKGIKDYYVYYCTSQRSSFLSNRFMAMPLERTRIIGMQMYQNNVRGFLHWGYNFYYSFLSREKINPFAVTDCMGRYQSGDSFIVYPGADGALTSIRNEAFLQGLQDYRALMLLEERLGRDKVCAFLEENGVAKNFHDYPKSAGWLIELRKQIKMKEEQRDLEKREILEEGRKVRQNNQKYLKNFERIKQEKINYLKSLNVKPLYIADLERFQVKI
jgi:hypothetical protein